MINYEINYMALVSWRVFGPKFVRISQFLGKRAYTEWTVVGGGGKSFSAKEKLTFLWFVVNKF